MAQTQPLIQKNVSPIRITLVMIGVVSLLYPLFFAYIDKQFSLRFLAVELLFTTARLTCIAFICYGIIWLSGKALRWAPSWLRHLLEVVVILFCAYWFLVAFIEGIDRPLTGSNPADGASWVFRRHIGLYLLATVFIYTFLSGLNYYHLAQQKAAQAEKLQREFAQVRLQALKSQVNPHFLFNSLSVLSSLVHVDAELSEKFILQLSKAYRYILDQKDADLVPLREELQFLDAYFFLLQIRFGQKVKLQQHIAPETIGYSLPPLTLQLLVENAVKHNAMSAAQPLIISIDAAGNELVVQNNISRRNQAETSTGIGLDNIKKRYALLTEGKVTIEQDAQTFKVHIPLIKTA